MKKIFISLFFIAFFISNSKAQWNNVSLSFDGKLREYKVYTPKNYNANNPAPLLFLLHGLNGTMNDIDSINATELADTAGIILVSPQALPFNNPIKPLTSAWNSGIVVTVPPLGAIAVNGSINDVGFLNALIDSCFVQFNINPNRIYLTGISMGGFMVQRAACELSARIAGIASISGTYSLTLPNCNPAKTIPMVHIHGTNDTVVTWNGTFDLDGTSFNVGLNVDTLIKNWVKIDGCNSTPIYDSWQDKNNDSFYVEHYSYLNANNKSVVELYKINKGEHLWYDYSNTDGELDYLTEVWGFFNKNYDPNFSSITTTSNVNLNIYPNPAKDFIYFSGIDYPISNIEITDMSGKVILKHTKINNGLSVEQLTSGVYILKLMDVTNRVTHRKFIKE